MLTERKRKESRKKAITIRMKKAVEGKLKVSQSHPLSQMEMKWLTPRRKREAVKKKRKSPTNRRKSGKRSTRSTTGKRKGRRHLSQTPSWTSCSLHLAVCCPDLSHCCPRGFRCDLAFQQCEKVTESWMDSSFLLKKAAAEPPVPPLQPMLYTSNNEKTRVPAVVDTSGRGEFGVIRCSSKFFCPQGTSCCKGLSAESWNCCPYPLGQCCADGQHCCEYGYTCNIHPLSCSRRNFMSPSAAWTQENAENGH
ncbi:protein FAM133 isoform X6 [Syngnathus acus]|uniref:protein FAM133 isoform X6 n=1 Tax=Syngnathus acus TaxID=161584 RepID=UPI001885BB05|nr:protein FAM133 isoform X6 [Syngnathus acus]